MNTWADRPSSRGVIAVLLAAATLLLFAPTWGYDFVNYDDPDYVTSNPHVQPVNPEAHASLGLVLGQLGQREAARRHLQTALKQRPDFTEAKA